LKSLLALNRAFREIVCFQWLSWRFASPFSRVVCFQWLSFSFRFAAAVFQLLNAKARRMALMRSAIWSRHSILKNTSNVSRFVKKMSIFFERPRLERALLPPSWPADPGGLPPKPREAILANAQRI
jgi:hypothetical protein